MSFKTFDLAHDVASLVSSINEVVTVSASLYNAGSGDQNVKKFENIASGSSPTSFGGYWETVFDSDPTSPQSTALFDLTFGFHPTSSFNIPASSNGAVPDEKVKVYRQMASILLGDADGRFSPGGSTYWDECFFVLIKRGLMKDEIKKGSVNIYLSGTNAYSMLTASDVGAATSFKQTVGGDYAALVSGTNSTVGLMFYNAGIAVIPADSRNVPGLPWDVDSTTWSGSTELSGGAGALLVSGTIDNLVDGYRGHMQKISFHNQTNLYSTVYFCRASNTEFNYSSNPTYIDENKRIRVTSGSNVMQSRTYVTTVGLYDASDNLLAVGKLNKPITKSPDTESIFRIRLDY